MYDCVCVYVSQYVVQLKMFVPPSFSYKECSRNKVMEIENGNESILELSAHLDNGLSVPIEDIAVSSGVFRKKFPLK